MPDKPEQKKSSGFEQGAESFKTGPKGHNYLLAIAIDAYEHCTPLNNAVHDVQAFVDLMKSRYNFDDQYITFIKDAAATRKRIEQEFIKLTKTVTPQDNLLVYFSGHGRYDEKLGGFWVPVEAGATDEDWSDYLSSDVLKSHLAKIESFHTFLIADSCFSGSLFIDKSKDKFTGDRRETEPSRWGLTSGKREIVSDGKPGAHSPFATALLDVLRKADQPPGVMRICDLVLEKVAANAQQTPMGSPLQISGHQGGQFVFHFRADEKADWAELQATPEGCHRYLALYPEGTYRKQAEALLAKEAEDKAWASALAAKSINALLSFETQFPQSPRVRAREVDAQIAQIEEDDLWQEATRSNSIAAYRDYLHRSRLKQYSQAANEAISRLLQKEQEPNAWQQAKTQDTKDAYEQYLSQFPQGPHAADARAALQQLEQAASQREQEARKAQEQAEQHRKAAAEAERKKQEEQARLEAEKRQAAAYTAAHANAWKEATDTHSIRAYEGYVAQFPQGAYVQEARSRIKELKRQAAAPVPWGRYAAIGGGGIALVLAIWLWVGQGTKDETQHAQPLATLPDSVHKQLVTPVFNDSTKKAEPQPQETQKTVEVPKQEAPKIQFDYPMVQVSGGTFMMGNTDKEVYDECPHSVTIGSFSIGKYEVTQALWKKIMGKNPSTHKNCDGCPVEQVTWGNVQAFIQKLNDATGLKYCLPTETEWEYAARGGEQRKGYKYAGANDLGSVAWYSANSGSKTHPVGGKSPNELGLYDMSGNVWEWCVDTYQIYRCDNKNKSNNTVRVIRGGCWGNDPVGCHVANRSYFEPLNRSNDIGFRLALSSQ